MIVQKYFFNMSRKRTGTGSLRNTSNDLHAIESFALIRDSFPISAIPEIPETYNSDTIVAVPVNFEKLFIYWEITDRLIRRSLPKPRTSSASLMIKVFDLSDGKAKCSLRVKEKAGQLYLSDRNLTAQLVAEIGTYKRGLFTCLLRSMAITMPFTGSGSIDDEIWMKKAGEKITVSSSPVIKSDGRKREEYFRKIMLSGKDIMSSQTIVKPRTLEP